MTWVMRQLMRHDLVVLGKTVGRLRRRITT